MAVSYKDIGDLSQKSSIEGTEKLPVSSVEYITPMQIAGLSAAKLYVGTCDTGASTAAKVVTVETFPTDSNGKPLIGTAIAVKFTNSNTAASATLNVNSTGAASIWYDSYSYSSASTVAGSAGRYCYYVWDGTYWVFLSWGIDNNTLAYQVRAQNASRPMTDDVYRYRLLFTSADGSKWVPATTSSSTNATSSRTVCQTKIDPFGPIVYYSSTSSVSSGNVPSAGNLYFQNYFTLGYSFNRTGAALTLTVNAPVYIKCTPQSDGSAIIDETTPYVQALPSSEDGKIYIFLGLAGSATQVEMSSSHPVYYYKDSAIRFWTNAPIPTSATVAGWGFAKYYLCADEAAYNAIDPKDSGTLYLIPET